MSHTTKERHKNRSERIASSRTYHLTKRIAKWMDRYYIDPIIGFFLPGYGDTITALLNLPYLYVSAFKVRSLPLTLAIIFNTLLDVLIGLIPVLGDLFDIFNKSYTKNSRLLTGFVEGDHSIIREVNRKAILLGVLCLILCLLIYLVILLIVRLGMWIGELGSSLVSLF